MRKTIVLLAALACAHAPRSAQRRTVTRGVICSGQPCGSSVTTWRDDGTIEHVLDVHDNGRGPHTDAVLQLAPDGTLASFEAHGHTEMGAPVEESFSLSQGKARWQSKFERGEVAAREPAFFMPLATADLDAFLFAALRQHGGDLALLPGGTAHLARAGEATVDGQHLIVWALSGFAFQPSYLWTDDAGELVCEVSSFSSVGPPEKIARLAEALIPVQLELDKARDRALQEKLAHRPPAAGVVLTHARLLDVERGSWVPDQSVQIRGETIEKIGPQLAIPPGAEVIDLHGQALLPGLWDMHAHFGPTDGMLNLASGVTTARDVGNQAKTLDDFKARFDAGSAIGPHLYRAGFIEGRGPDAAHAEVTATTEEEAKAAVEHWHQLGYDMIKIYNSVPPALVPLLAREAHARGMKVTGHIPAHMLAHEAVLAGYDGIEHVNQVLLDFFADHETDTRTLRRFSLPGERAADFDYASPQAQQLFALFREHQTVIDPTLVTFEQLYVGQQGEVPEGQRRLAERLPIQVKRGYLTGGLDMEGKRELYARSWEKMKQLPKALHEAHVPVVAGTDALAGLSLQRELELFVEGGLSPAQSLQDATIVPAKAMGAGERSGSIAPGKLADLVVVDGDPLADIRAVERTRIVFRAGVRYDCAELYRSISVAP